MALIKAARRKKRVFFQRYSLLLLNFEAKAKCNQLQHRLTTAIGVTTRKCANCPAAAAVLAYKKKRNIINWSYQQQADNIVGKMTIAALDAEMWVKEKAAFAQVTSLTGGTFPVVTRSCKLRSGSSFAAWPSELVETLCRSYERF
jgi:hypothetical protein